MTGVETGIEPPRRPPAPRMLAAGAAPVTKVLLISGLIVVLLVPLMLVYGLVTERESRYREVVNEIGQNWSFAQQVTGPILAIPYRERVSEGRSTRPVRRTAFLLPDSYVVDATVDPQVRQRGIYEAAVYTAELRIAGDFGRLDREVFAGLDGEVLWDEARLLVGVTDQRGIQEGLSIDWRGQALPLEPGTDPVLARIVPAGVVAELPDLAGGAGVSAPFDLRLTLTGSDSLTFLPLGRESTVRVFSDWPDPSSIGSPLPKYEDLPEGFAAEWTTTYFARSYPQEWTEPVIDQIVYSALPASAFGVRFFQPVSDYQQTERALKYGVLFLVFTFGLFFLFEMLSGLRIHIFQYGLVGLSLCLFYLLLLSLAEHVGFAAAYAIGAVAVVGQIAFYTSGALGRRRVLLLAGLLAALYAGLYGLLQLEDLALLLGSIALFVALGAVMAVTRNIDWYATGQRPAPAAGG